MPAGLLPSMTDVIQGLAIQIIHALRRDIRAHTIGVKYANVAIGVERAQASSS
jgi:hypothetical protein